MTSFSYRLLFLGAMMVAGAGQGGAQLALAASARPSDAEIEAGRRQRASDMLTINKPAIPRYVRDGCFKDDGPASVAKARAGGDVMTPDASDTCIAAMVRQARDGALGGPYQDLLDDQTGDARAAANREELMHQLGGRLTAQGGIVTAAALQLPQHIADAIRTGAGQVDLGQGHLLPISSGLALDTGFTLAYVEGVNANPRHVTDLAKLKAATENCVGQRGDNRVCFTAGYIQGATAYASAHQSAALTP